MLSPRRLVPLMAVVVCATEALASQVPEAQRQEVLAFVRAYAEAANRGDVTAYMDMYSQRAQLIAVNDGDITRGWDKLRDEANAMLGLEGSYRISVGSTDVIGLGATRAIAVFPFVANVATQQGTAQLRGAMTLVLEKGSQGWKIIHDHTSTAPASPQ